MARQPRLVIPDLPHHVILRGNNRRRLFTYPRDYHQFLFFLSRALTMDRCTLHALTLMTNHIHLLVTPRAIDAMSSFVKFVAQRYAQVRNQRRMSSGRIFEERFFSVPVTSEEQLAVTTAYIELNPVRAGLVEHAGDYVWSTYRLHVARPDGVVPRGLWTPSSWYESLSDHPVERAELDERWVTEVRSRDRRPERLSAKARVELEALFGATLRERRPDRSCAS